MTPGMYLRIFESYVRWVESRGSSPLWARVTVVSTLTAAAFMNAIALALIVQAVGGPRIVDWVADHLWVAWVAALVCAAGHWQLGRRMPPANNREPVLVTRTLWTSYMVLTLIFWVVAVAVTLVKMT
jgi:hypothetical protein